MTTIQASAREFPFDRAKYTLDVTTRVSKETERRMASSGALPSEVDSEVSYATKKELSAIANLSDSELGVCQGFHTLPSRYLAQKPQTTP